VIGPGIIPDGEMKTASRIYQKQIAPTIAELLGEEFINSKSNPEPILPGSLSNTNLAIGNAGVH
jgi:hypothetical protein